MNSLPTPVPRVSAAQLPATRFHLSTLVVAIVASSTTFLTLGAALPAWTMFLGWVAHDTAGSTLREGVANLVSFLLGLGLGAGTGIAIGLLTPVVGDAATPLAVLGDVIVVLSLRNLRPINNPLANFLGHISFFASAQAPSASLLGMLAAAGIIGAAGAAMAGWLQSRVERRPV
ncbi:DUF1097 domain-containing protein [Massilia niastensis]|uniref:DUF1097 domain-containing protein n=1 Tax=Massilia niastensis TaxID=544911 RepID=UPI000A03F7E6|nr:DUF1097 domain-containing protein [Massilia niastensis]